MPGRHVTDRQKRLFMTLKKTHTIDVAAAKAGFSRATGYRLAEDPSLLSGKAAPRGRRRPDPLPTADYEETSVVVTSSSGFTLRRVFYTVPSRLIGHRLGVRLYDDRLELFLSGTRHLTLPRGRPSKTGTHVHVVNYRHVIHSLKRKPMALLNLVYRDALFPRDAYRRCFEAALERLTEREACRLAVTLLALAHEENCEAELAAEIDRVLDKGRLPAPNDLKARFAPDPGQMPRIDVARPHLAGYGSLLGAGGAS